MAFDPFGVEPDEDAALSAGEVEAIRRGESSMPDAHAAEALVDRISGLMVSVATGGPRIKEVEASYKREHRALAAVLRRLGIDYPNMFDDLWQWHGRWSDESMPTYASRRVYISNLFAPVRQALTERADATHELARGIEEATGWSTIDAQVARLRRLWREADDADAYNGVGLQCVKVLTTLGQVVFDPKRDLPAGEEEPGPDDAKKRINFHVRRLAAGERAENVRKVVNASYAQANAAKHRHTATRTDAGVAANATVLIVSTLRLLADEDEVSSRRGTPQPPRRIRAQWPGLAPGTDDDIPF